MTGSNRNSDFAQSPEVIDLISDSDDEPPRAAPPHTPIRNSSVPVVSNSLSVLKRPYSEDNSALTETKRPKTEKSLKIKLEFEPKNFGEANFGDEVVEVAPAETTAEVAQLLQATSSNGANGDDVEFVGGNATVASEMPHARESCTQFLFTPVPHTSNEKRCHFCYCYVCDTIASDCWEWTMHCNATLKNETWRRERKMRSSGAFVHLNPVAKSVFMKRHYDLIKRVSAESNDYSYASYGGGYYVTVFSDDEYGAPSQSSFAHVNYLQYDGEYLENLIECQRSSATKAVDKLLIAGYDAMRELRAISNADSCEQSENSEEFKFAEACTILLMLLNTVVGKRCKRLWDSSCAVLMVAVLLNPQCNHKHRASFSAICTDANFDRMGKRCVKLRATSALLRASDADFETIYRDDVTSTVFLSTVAALLPQSLFQEMAARKYKRTLAKLIEHEPIGLLVSAVIFLLESNDEESVDLCRSMLQRVVRECGNFTLDILQVEVTRCLLHVERRGVVLLMAMILDLQISSAADVDISRCQNILLIIASKWEHKAIVGGSDSANACDSFASQNIGNMLARARRCLRDENVSSMLGVVVVILVFSSQLCFGRRELFSDSAVEKQILFQLDQIFISLKNKSLKVAVANGIAAYQPPFTVDKQVMLRIGRLLIVRECIDSGSSFDCLKSVSGALKTEMSKVPSLYCASSIIADGKPSCSSSMYNDTHTITRQHDIEQRLIVYLSAVTERLTADNSSQRLHLLLHDYELSCNMLWTESFIALFQSSITKDTSKSPTPSNEKITSAATVCSIFENIWKVSTIEFLHEWFEEIKSFKMVSDNSSMMAINFFCLSCAAALLHMPEESTEEALFITRSLKWIFVSEGVVASWDKFASLYGFGPTREGSSSADILNYSILNAFWCPVLSSSPIFAADAAVSNIGALILLGSWDRLKSTSQHLSVGHILIVVNQLLLLTADEYSAIEHSDTIGKSTIDGILAVIINGSSDRILSAISKSCCSSPSSFLSVAIHRTDPNLIIPAAQRRFPFFLAVLRDHAGPGSAFDKVYIDVADEVSKYVVLSEVYDENIVLCCCVTNSFNKVSDLLRKYGRVLTVETISEMLYLCGDVGLFVQEFEHSLAELYLDPSVPTKLQSAVARVRIAPTNLTSEKSNAYVKLLLFYHHYGLDSFQDLFASIEVVDLTRLVKNWMQKVQDSSRVNTTIHLNILFKLLGEFDMRNYLSHLSLFTNEMRFDKSETVDVLLQKSVDQPQLRLSLFLCIAQILLTMDSMSPAIRQRLRETLSADMISFIRDKVSKDAAEMYSLIHLVLYLNDPLSESRYLDHLKQAKPEMFRTKKDKILSLVINDADLCTTIKVLTQERALSTLLDHLKNNCILRKKDDHFQALTAVLHHLADNMALPLFLPDAPIYNVPAELENQLLGPSSTINKFIEFVLSVQEQIKLVEMITVGDRTTQANPQLLASYYAYKVAVQDAFNRLVTVVGKVTDSEVISEILKLCIAFIPANIYALYTSCTSRGYYHKDAVTESFADYHTANREVKYGLTRMAKILDWVIFRVVSAESCVHYDIEKIQTLLEVSKAGTSCGLVALFSVHQNFCSLIRYIVEEKSTKFYNGRDNKIEISKKGMLHVSFKKLKNTQVAEKLMNLLTSHGRAAVAMLEPLLLNRMNDCDINAMTNFTTSNFQSAYVNSIMLRKEFKQVIDLAISVASPDLNYLHAMMNLKDHKSNVMPWSFAVQSVFVLLFQTPLADKSVCIAIIASTVMNIIVSKKQNMPSMLSLLFFKYENFLHGTGRKSLFNEAIIAAVVEHFIANHRGPLQTELVLNLSTASSRGIDVEDVVRQPLLLKEVTTARTGQEILQRASKNFDCWECILRHTTSPEVRHKFCEYLVACVQLITIYARDHTVRNATKNNFQETVIVFSRLMPYIREFDSIRMQLVKVAGESKKMLKTKKAVADMVKMLEQC